MKSSPALFLDRDGVINKEVNYLYKIEDFEFIDGIFEVCKHFKERGYKIIIVTNQAGIARGFYTVKDFEKLNLWMLKQFKKQGIHIDNVYFCPHHPEGKISALSISCDCRKPAPAMLLKAKQAFNIDMKKSLLIGDKVSDILAGKNANIGRNILVRTGHPINGEDVLIADKVIDSVKELTSL